MEELPDDTKRMVNLAAEKGASNWLVVLPVDEHGFYLYKTAFRDAICLRFGWKPDQLPEKCECESNFTVEHALTCNCGGFSFLRHNEIRDLSAKLLTEVCPNVGIEPGLEPLFGETLVMRTANRHNEARLDIRAQGFWGKRWQDTFFDVRVFNPIAPSNRHTSPTACYKKHEKEKRRAYNQRVREIEHGTFTPLFSQPQGAWAQLPKCSTEDWQASSVRSSSNHMARQWDGSTAA